MSNSCDILALANEHLLHILLVGDLDHKDLASLSQTCKRLRLLCQDDIIWKVTYNKRWPIWFVVPPQSNCWAETFKKRHVWEIKIKDLIEKTARDVYMFDEIPNEYLDQYIELCKEDQQEIELTLEVLHNFSVQRGDLQLQYYAKKLFIHVKHHRLKYDWIELLNKQTETPKNLELGAILISEWIEPCESFKRIKPTIVLEELDKLADRVKQKYEKDFGDLSGFCQNTLQGISIINSVLYDEVGFRGNVGNYYEVRNSLIDQVLLLHKGIPITLSIVYSAVAFRLGLVMHGVNFPGHFLLRFEAESNGKTCIKFLDAFDRGVVYDENDCLRKFIPYHNHDSEAYRSILSEVVSCKRIFIRMMANIVNVLRAHTRMDSNAAEALLCALELTLLLNPECDESRLLLSRIYLHYKVNLKEVYNNLNSILARPGASFDKILLRNLVQYAQAQVEDMKDKQVIPKYRSDSKHKNVLFEVGAIMRHKRYNYKCVIYGWDPTCQQSEEWKQRMGVYTLPKQDTQPFYSVLASDGSERYAAQENLEPLTEAEIILHDKLGKYFHDFDGIRYVATALLKEEYPEDQCPEDQSKPDEE